MQIIYKNQIFDVKKGTKVIELFNNEIKKSNNEIIACKFNNEIKSLNYEIDSDGKLELIDITNKDGMRVYQRGLIYIIAKAFYDLYPKALFTVNYQLYHSMLCEIDNLNVTKEMINKVKKRVEEIIQEDLPITKKVMSKKEAESFYEKEKTLKGKLQLDLQQKKEVTLYYCENYYNYFYGVMPISTGYIKKYDILKYHDGFLIRYPSRKEPHQLSKLIESPKLLETLDEYEDVHKILNINTLYKLNETIKSNKIKDYILLDEALHEKKIAQIVDKIYRSKKTKVILIAGPSCSGKTTFAKRLELQLKINGLKPKTISVDNYFVERQETPKDENGEFDFENIEAINTKLLNDDLIKLLNGQEVKMPTFNFHTGVKEYKGNIMKLEDDEVLIMEGIHCLNDRLTFLIPKEQKFKIYISCLTVLNIDYFNRISTTDTRLIRRIARDNQFRGYSAIHTLKMWPSVNKGEAINIFSYQEEADIMFNSSLIYELSVLKDYVIKLLSEIKPEEPEFSEAKRIYWLLSYFESIPPKFVPSNSLLREFIGGSIFEK
ncbi:MAG: nucleoside kinase [Clostridia bacterium]|nr:nucleoside kinase [Clostridia bacterium]